MKRVLVVDDDPIVRSSVAEALRAEGFEVTTAASGGVALRFFEEQPADLLIANVYMARGDGLKVVAELNRIRPELRIIALSPSPVPAGYLTAARAFGAARVLMKPFEPASLLDAVAGLVKGRPGP